MTSAFSPTAILVKDQSHLHAGHAGARDGKGHFSVNITSHVFADLPQIQCHRLIFDALGDMMETDIHALTIKAQAPTDSNGL